MRTVCRIMAWCLLVPILICILSCNTSVRRHSQPKLNEFPVPGSLSTNRPPAGPETPGPKKIEPEPPLAMPATSGSKEVKSKAPAVVQGVPSKLEPPITTPEPRFYVHKIRWPGETLSIIAKWYRGSFKNWKALSNANPTLDLKRIVIGTNIFIPEDLLKSHDPMPFSFIASLAPKKRVQTFTGKKPSKASGAAHLFGPIEKGQVAEASGRVELFGPIENDQASIAPDVIELFKPME